MHDMAKMLRRIYSAKTKIIRSVIFVLTVLCVMLVLEVVEKKSATVSKSTNLKVSRNYRNEKHHVMTETSDGKKKKLGQSGTNNYVRQTVFQHTPTIKQSVLQTSSKQVSVQPPSIASSVQQVFQQPDMFGNEIKEKIRLLKHKVNSTPKRQNKANMTEAEISKDEDEPLNRSTLYVNNNVEQLVHYEKNEPLIWVTGYPRSGSTLMRAMLDAHPDIRCGPETSVIPMIFSRHENKMQSKHEMDRLYAANIDKNVINNAMGAYIMTVIKGQGSPAKRLCTKDPFTVRAGDRIKKMFPHSKFIFMIRDGRAVVHSSIVHKVRIMGLDLASYVNSLKGWNLIATRQVNYCLEMGPESCFPVYYEQLVLHPREQMTKILKFLGIDWNDLVLQHHKHFTPTGAEISSKLVKNPINSIPLTLWADKFPVEERPAVLEAAPLLDILGYDPEAFPPNYGKPDPMVAANDREVKEMNDENGTSE